MGGTKTALTLLLILGLATAAPSRAEKPADGQLGLEEIAVMLSSSEGDDVRTAIEASASLGSKDVVPLLSERIKAGLPPDLLRSAVDSLMLIGDASAAPIFAALASHRSEAIRVSAIEALASVAAKGAAEVLQKALGDGSEKVREAAATGLGEIGDASALPVLFKAFDRQVHAAAPAIGKLAGEAQLSQLMGYLGQVPFTSLSPAFDAFMARRDTSEAMQLKLVAELTELGTAEARGYLERLQAELPPDTRPRVRRAIDDAIVRIAQ